MLKLTYNEFPSYYPFQIIISKALSGRSWKIANFKLNYLERVPTNSILNVFPFLPHLQLVTRIIVLSLFTRLNHFPKIVLLYALLFILLHALCYALGGKWSPQRIITNLVGVSEAHEGFPCILDYVCSVLIKNVLVPWNAASNCILIGSSASFPPQAATRKTKSPKMVPALSIVTRRLHWPRAALPQANRSHT